MKSGSKSRVRVHVRVTVFGFSSGNYHRVTLGFSGLSGFHTMNVLNVGFRVGFDFIGFRLFPPEFWVFGYPNSSLVWGCQTKQSYLCAKSKCNSLNHDNLLRKPKHHHLKRFLFQKSVLFQITSNHLQSYIVFDAGLKIRLPYNSIPQKKKTLAKLNFSFLSK